MNHDHQGIPGGRYQRTLLRLHPEKANPGHAESGEPETI